MLIDSAHLKAGVRLQPIPPEIQAVFDQKSPRERVVAYSISANPGVAQGQRKHKKNDQSFIIAAKAIQPAARQVDHAPGRVAKATLARSASLFPAGTFRRMAISESGGSGRTGS